MEPLCKTCQRKNCPLPFADRDLLQGTVSFNLITDGAYSRGSPRKNTGPWRQLGAGTCSQGCRKLCELPSIFSSPMLCTSRKKRTIGNYRGCSASFFSKLLSQKVALRSPENSYVYERTQLSFFLAIKLSKEMNK